MGITDIIYSEITRYRDKRLAQEEKQEIAYGMIKKILRSYKNLWNIHMSSENPGYIDDEINVYVALLNDALAETHGVVSDEIREETLKMAKDMHRCSSQIKGIGRENWERYVTCIEKSIERSDSLIRRIEEL
ncbi:MAG: hypothetical protein PHZ19_01650 [Candidatus Thermoplasmatota archaeon]|nr:hypothetical protein [Candidatus Thermoplasmatota archaeon]